MLHFLGDLLSPDLPGKYCNWYNLFYIYYKLFNKSIDKLYLNLFIHIL